MVQIIPRFADIIQVPPTKADGISHWLAGAEPVLASRESLVAEADDEDEDGEPLDMSKYGNKEMELCDKFEDTHMM